MDFTEMIKETHIKRFYGGANGNKKAVDINGSVYMIKFPPKKENLKISYINSCISEYIGCKIFKSIGIPVQEVILGTIIEKSKKKIVVACKDFTSPGIILQDFAAIKNSCIGSSNNGYGVELSEIKEAIREQQAVPEELVTRRFWDMFVVDALIGNFDRHNGNWGFLINVLDNTVELAPVFDCGSSLLPQADDTVKKDILLNENAMDNRIYVFPTSAIKINNKKIGYYDFLISAVDPDCNEAVKRIVPKIKMQSINQIINECEYINDLDKAFYSSYIQNRYEKILEPSLEKVLEQDRKNSLKQPKFEITHKKEIELEEYENEYDCEFER